MWRSLLLNDRKQYEERLASVLTNFDTNMDFMTQQQTQVNTMAKDLIEDKNVCVRNIQNMKMNVNQLEKSCSIL